jgi:N-acetylglucosaminyldiphosphoundecaprenol N-acetyl-beta-D-mannosaminyltransferase
MATPTQERWIDGNQAALDVPVIWAVGALFDFVNGRIPRGPAWMTGHGLEWLCRLAAEPAKLWRRYVIGNPRFLLRVLRVWWRQTRG